MLDYNDPEVKRVAQEAQELKDAMEQLMNHYSSWTKLKRAVAWFLKVKDLLKELRTNNKKTCTSSGESRVNQFKKACKGTHLAIVKYCQQISKKTWLA